MENNLIKVVITGGPCAGKTSAIEKVKVHFEKWGYPGFCVNLKFGSKMII